MEGRRKEGAREGRERSPAHPFRFNLGLAGAGWMMEKYEEDNIQCDKTDERMRGN